VSPEFPEPVRNSAFTQALGDALRRPARLRYPAALVRGLAGEFLLAGQRVLPAKVEASGFEFHYPTLASALASLSGREPLTHPPAAMPALYSPAACLAGENAGTTSPNTSPSLARVAAPALEDCVGDAARDIELARRPG
jgi:hypothetical protein